jgi:hypothetical protein
VLGADALRHGNGTPRVAVFKLYPETRLSP